MRKYISIVIVIVITQVLFPREERLESMDQSDNLFAEAPDWSFNEADYDFNSGVTAIVSLDGIVQDGDGDLLASFAPDGTLRGVSEDAGKFTFGPFSGTTYFELQVYGGTEEEDDLFTFQYYSVTNDMVYDLEETLNFNPPNPYGNVVSPFELNGSTLSFDQGILPTDYTINNIYPNPFNPVANITYGLPSSGNVKVLVYNIVGEEITTLVNAFQTAGYHSVSWNADSYSSGMYFVRMIAGEYVSTQILMLIK